MKEIFPFVISAVFLSDLINIFANMRVRPWGTFGLQYIICVMIYLRQNIPAAGQQLPSEEVEEGSFVPATH